MSMGEGGLDWGAWVEAQARPRLLLVDDEPVNLQLLKRVLEADYRLVFARSGEEALARVRAGAPDLILLDVMMPGMSGHEVIRALKADPATAGIPVPFCTALDQDEDEAFGLGLGAVDYVTKPVSPAVLKARVRTYLQLVQRGEIERTRLEVIHRLGRAAEFKGQRNRHARDPHEPLQPARRRGPGCSGALVRAAAGRSADARHRQDRHPRRHPAQARQARRV